MGLVYKAFDERLQRVVALKVLPASFADNDERKSRFLREARSAAAVTHANIATLYEVGEAEGRVFLVMEYVEGKTIGRILKEGALTVTEALRIARGIARGLAKAHERGIVHRDMKPENVMLDTDGDVKILDFGLAKLREEQGGGVLPSKSVLEQDETEAAATKEGHILGTPGYMSPEQAKGKLVDHRTDIFSLGLVLYEMLTGQKAFKGETSLDVIIAVSRDAHVPPSKLNPAVTPEMQRIVDTCLAKDPGERYATARDLVTAIDAIVSPSASGPSAVTAPSGSGARPASARRRIVGLAALAIAAFGAGTFALGMRHGDKPPVRTAASVKPLPPTGPAPTAITALPPPKTGVPAAASEYAAAMQAARDGSLANAGEHLVKATQLDPGFAAANVMLVMIDDQMLEDARRRFALASDHRADLSTRDLAMLEVTRDQLTRGGPDFEADWLAWTGLMQRFPGDALIALLASRRAFQASHDAEGFALLERATTLDPKFVWPLNDEAIALGDRGRFDEVLAVVDRCLSISPTAASCIRRRAEIEERRGECGKVLESAYGMVAVEPEGPLAYEWLATGLISTNAPIESVELALRKRRELEYEPRQKAFLDQVAPTTRPWLEGDVAAIQMLFPQWEAVLGTDASDSCVSGLVVNEARIYEEERDPGRAVTVYDTYWKRLPGLVQDEPIGARAAALWSERRAGHLSEAQFQAKRDEWVKYSRARMRAAAASPWFAYYAAYTSTPAEAQEALAALPRFSPLPPYEGLVFEETAMGHVLRLAGRADEAEPHLRRAANACYGWGDVPWHVSAAYELGELLEAKHDSTGACAAYDAVVQRWGGARAKTATAADAIAHEAKLGCKH